MNSARDIELAQHPIYASQEADTRRSALIDELETVAQSLRDAGYTVQCEADLGNPAEAIIERANALESDFQFDWHKESWKPWDWKLTAVRQPELHIDTSYFQ